VDNLVCSCQTCNLIKRDYDPRTAFNGATPSREQTVPAARREIHARRAGIAPTTVELGKEALPLVPSLETAWQDVDSSFERFCLTAGIGAIEQMLCEAAQHLVGRPHNRGGGRVGHRWGRTKGRIRFHGGKVAVHRPRVRSYDGHEVALPTWTAAQAEDWLGRWAMNLMLINVSTRKLPRAICRSLPATAPRSQRPRAGS